MAPCSSAAEIRRHSCYGTAWPRVRCSLLSRARVIHTLEAALGIVDSRWLTGVFCFGFAVGESFTAPAPKGISPSRHRLESIIVGRRNISLVVVASSSAFTTHRCFQDAPSHDVYTEPRRAWIATTSSALRTSALAPEISPSKSLRPYHPQLCV